MTQWASRLPLSLDPLIAEAKRRARHRRTLVAVSLAAVAAAGVGLTFGLDLIVPRHVPTVSLAGCGSAVSGQGFRAFGCMSGGGGTGRGHGREILVIRSDGSSVAYPDYGGGFLAVGDGEVVATHDDSSLVRVTSSRLIPLVTPGELRRALHLRPTALAYIYAPKVDAHGGVYFRASVFPGCQNRLLKRTAGGAIHQIRALRDKICH